MLVGKRRVRPPERRPLPANCAMRRHGSQPAPLARHQHGSHEEFEWHIKDF
jgi:hypothetical protein